MLSGWLSTRGALFSKRPTDLDRPKVHYGEMECENVRESAIRSQESGMKHQQSQISRPRFPTPEA
jgi:hypothetical protein